MPGKNKKTAKDEHRPPSVSNRRAHHEYDISESYEAGLVLTGTEVKSLRRGKATLTDSFCVLEGGEIWLRHMHISPYEQGNRYNVDSVRARKLLLHNWQIAQLATKTREKGMSIIPLRLFFVRGRAKVEIGVGRGRKLYDRRDRIADRDRDREMQREMAQRE